MDIGVQAIADDAEPGTLEQLLSRIQVYLN